MKTFVEMEGLLVRVWLLDFGADLCFLVSNFRFDVIRIWIFGLIQNLSLEYSNRKSSYRKLKFFPPQLYQLARKSYYYCHRV